MPLPSDSQFLEGVHLFNEREFFACHDAWEEVWGETIGDDREFYQGLIHAAVALHHFEEGNLTGARKMFESTQKYLGPFAPSHHGVDLDTFLIKLRDCFGPLLESNHTYPADATLNPDRIPVLLLDAEFARTEALP